MECRDAHMHRTARTYTHALTHARTHAHTRTHTYTHTCTRTRARTHTHAHAHTSGDTVEVELQVTEIGDMALEGASTGAY